MSSKAPARWSPSDRRFRVPRKVALEVDDALAVSSSTMTDTTAFRTEKDTLGEVLVPADRYWGAQTQRSLHNFEIGDERQRMPIEIVHAFAVVKKAAAMANAELTDFPRAKADQIAAVCDEILEGRLDDHFPLVVWQTGSGTQSNMNVNEVVSNRAIEKLGGRLGSKDPIHPNDDVNRSQSSNDTFPTAMHVAAVEAIRNGTLPKVRALSATLRAKARAFDDVVKIGRTHLMDATPLTLGQEIGGWATQLEHGAVVLERSLDHLYELALGGTAVGTGLNAPRGFAKRVAEIVADLTGHPFVTAHDKFEALSAHDAVVEASGALKRLAVSGMHVGNAVRMLASGPRCGIGEIVIPANEPGSSIMPGKVNPTQAEAWTMVCAQVIGNDVAVSMGGAQGHFQLNVFKPMMIRNLLESARLFGDACASFDRHCAQGIEPDRARIRMHLDESLMLVTALNAKIGYYEAARIAQRAHADGTTLREAALASGSLTAEEFDATVVPERMIPREP
jgi:fumarate hydratase class II